MKAGIKVKSKANKYLFLGLPEDRQIGVDEVKAACNAAQQWRLDVERNLLAVTTFPDAPKEHIAAVLSDALAYWLWVNNENTIRRNF